MCNPNTPIAAAFSTLMWATSFALASVYTATGARGLGVFAILCMGAGATLTVHQFMVNLADELIERERNAFDLGRDSRMRSVD